jgi:hypothetical protein
MVKEKSMRYRLAVACALMWISLSAFAQVEVKYDEAEKQTVVKTPDRDPTKAPQVQLLAIKEEVAADPTAKTIAIMFVAKSPEYQYLKCHAVSALADGKPVAVGESDHDGEAQKGSVVEYVTLQVNLKTLNTLAKASTVKFTVCNDSVQLTAAEMGQFKEFYEAVLPLAAPPAASPAPPASAAPAVPASPAPAATTPATPPPSVPAPAAPAPAAPAPASPAPAAPATASPVPPAAAPAAAAPVAPAPASPAPAEKPSKGTG